VKLHASTFNDQITQLFINIEVLTETLSNQITNTDDLGIVVKSLLHKNTSIRSLYVIDEQKQIVYSSNNSGMGKKVDISQYYPKPMFSNVSILRFGKLQEGRDLFNKDKALSYIPIVKKIQTDKKIYHVLLIINNSYFTNVFSKHILPTAEEVKLIRLDGSILYSNNLKSTGVSDIQKSTLYQTSLDKSFAYGIETIDEAKVIGAYYLSDLYPFVVSVQLDYEKNLKEWKYKTFLALLFIGIIVVIIAFIIIRLIVKYKHIQEKEIAYQKRQLINQEKIRNAYIVFENTNDGIVITNEECEIIDVNKAFIENTGYSLLEIKGQNPRFLKSDMHNSEFYEAMWDSIEKNKFWHGEIVNKKKNGDLYTELLTINKVLDRDKKVKNYIGVFTNITKQKEQEEQIKEQEKFIFQQSKMAAMGEMLENIAHQWRQPLSVISTAATAPIMEDKLGVSNSQNNLDRFVLINESAQLLSQTIDDFRDFFRPDKEKKHFNIKNVINKALKILTSKFRNRNIQVIQSVEDITVFGYESELVQVVMNILNNARDVLENIEEHQRFIFLNIYEKEKYVYIDIKDSGKGIPEDIVEKIFEPYFTTKHQSQGTGIGLYMSEEIVSKHMNGKLSVENISYEYENNRYTGAKFTIKIPVT
jgi:PAS domain S-box-containing protein